MQHQFANEAPAINNAGNKWFEISLLYVPPVPLFILTELHAHSPTSLSATRILTANFSNSTNFIPVINLQTEWTWKKWNILARYEWEHAAMFHFQAKFQLNWPMGGLEMGVSLRISK